MGKLKQTAPKSKLAATINQNKTDLTLPIPRLQNMTHAQVSVGGTSFAKNVNMAVKMMHKHAGIRKGRQSV